MKTKISRLYHMCGRLNLYVLNCKIKNDMVLKELESIKTLLNEIINDFNFG